MARDWKNRLHFSVLIGSLSWLMLSDVPALAQPSPERFIEICGSGTVQELAQALAAGAEVSTANDFGVTPLMATAFDESGTAAAKAELLLAAGADPNWRDVKGGTALHYAAGQGRADLIETLLAAGRRVDESDRTGLTALMTAAESSGDPAAVAALLAAGADAGRIDDQGRTALDYARRNQTPAAAEIIRLLNEASGSGPPE